MELDSGFANYCECGRPKYKNNRKCAVCSSANPHEKNARHYDECPSCGGPKRKHAKLCRKCRFGRNIQEPVRQTKDWRGEVPDYSSISAKEWAFISGLICGEGTIGFQTSNTIRITIALHQKDRELVEYLHSRLGGSLSIGKTRPMVAWNAQGMMLCKSILSHVLPFARAFHSAKAQDMEIALEFIDWRILLGRNWGRDKKMTPEAQATIDSYRERLKAVKVR